jgi:hypothetical protein
MNTSDTEIRILSIAFTRSHLVAKLSDGRTVSNPLKWYPRLQSASVRDRAAFELSGNGYGVHWGKIDEDLSAKGIAEGVASVEYRALAHRVGTTRRRRSILKAIVIGDQAAREGQTVTHHGARKRLARWLK